MTKAGSFKRAVRARAHETGERYTEARAALEIDARRARIARPVHHEALRAHLQHTYRITVKSLRAFDDDHAATLVIEHSGGSPWVARVFSSVADSIERVRQDAEILRWLERQNFPAERLAHREPVSLLNGEGLTAGGGDEHRFGDRQELSLPKQSAVLVTEFVEGDRAVGLANQKRLGLLLGRLHALEPADGATSRAGGSFDHDPEFTGRPSQDLRAALSFLKIVEPRIDRVHREKFEWLRDQVVNGEDCDGLPEAFTHGNFIDANAIKNASGEITIVGWSASGTAPRLASLAWLLFCSGGSESEVAAVITGYREHITLTDEEISRLEHALMTRYLYLACWYYWLSVSSGYTPSGIEGWWPDPSQAAHVASRAIAALGQDR